MYGAARKTYLKELNTIHHQELRLSPGAYSTSFIESLYTEADEPPLTLRRKKLALQYSTKLKSCSFNPAYDSTFNPKYKQHFDRKEKTTKPLGLRIKSTLQQSKIPLNNIHESNFPQIQPWIIKTPKVILELLKPQHSNPNPNPLANQLCCSDFLTPPTPLIIPHRLPVFLECLMPLKN